MTLALLRRLARLVGRPVRRIQLARGRRPAGVVVQLNRRPAGVVVMRVAGWARWWASEEDVRAELARAWGAARREFRERHPGDDVALGGAVDLVHEWEYRP